MMNILNQNDCGRAVACKNKFTLMMNSETDLQLLRLLEKNPHVTQRDLSVTTGLSLGKINFLLKALKDKGLIKWQNFSSSPNKLKYSYLLTPQGVFEKTQLTLYFLERKQAEYDQLRMNILRMKEELKIASALSQEGDKGEVASTSKGLRETSHQMSGDSNILGACKPRIT
jgi:EPS-associated MarR family transcriptional regulator